MGAHKHRMMQGWEEKRMGGWQGARPGGHKDGTRAQRWEGAKAFLLILSCTLGLSCPLILLKTKRPYHKSSDLSRVANIVSSDTEGISCHILSNSQQLFLFLFGWLRLSA